MLRRRRPKCSQRSLTSRAMGQAQARAREALLSTAVRPRQAHHRESSAGRGGGSPSTVLSLDGSRRNSSRLMTRRRRRVAADRVAADKSASDSWGRVAADMVSADSGGTSSGRGGGPPKRIRPHTERKPHLQAGPAQTRLPRTPPHLSSSTLRPATPDGAQMQMPTAQVPTAQVAVPTAQVLTAHPPTRPPPTRAPRGV